MHFLLVFTIFFCNFFIVNSDFNVLAFYEFDDEDDHVNFVNESLKWFPQHAAQNSYQFNSTDDWNNLNPDHIKHYQLIMFLNKPPQDANQRQAFQDYMENGGGWMGFHFCSWYENATEWPWYHNTFLGTGMYKNNTWFPTRTVLHNEAPDHPVMKGIPDRFNSSISEWYSWQNDLRTNSDIKILASIDESNFPVGTDPEQSWYSGYYPVIWSHNKYRMIYANFGHNLMDYNKTIGTSSTFDSNDQNKFLLQGLHWLAGK